MYNGFIEIHPFFMEAPNCPTQNPTSASVIMDEDGSLLSEMRMPMHFWHICTFGEVRLDVGDTITETDLGYTGQRNYGDFGLMDYHARFYSPRLGRFVQPDTIVPSLGNSQAWDRYSYVINNPIKFSDPSGHSYYCEINPEECEGHPDDSINDELMTIEKYEEQLKQEEVVEFVDDVIFNEWFNRETGILERSLKAEYLEGGGSLQAMIAISDFAAGVYGDDWEGFIKALSLIFLGVATNNPNSMLDGRNAGKYGDLTYDFGDEGFRKNYQDGTNQVRHVWAAIAGTAFPGNPIKNGIGNLTSEIGTWAHEGEDFVQHLFTGKASGDSWEDINLSYQGMNIGRMITAGNIQSPGDLGNYLQLLLGP